MCIDRVKAGLVPACAKTCPTGAIKYGEREELIAQAKAEGFKILHGEKELGGLGVVFALNKDPKYYELAENPKAPEKVVALGEILRILVAKGIPINNSIIREFLS